MVGNGHNHEVKVNQDHYLHQGRRQGSNRTQDFSQLKFRYLYLLWAGMDQSEKGWYRQIFILATIWGWTGMWAILASHLNSPLIDLHQLFFLQNFRNRNPNIEDRALIHKSNSDSIL